MRVRLLVALPLIAAALLGGAPAAALANHAAAKPATMSVSNEAGRTWSLYKCH